jgi:hypothetical protein
MEACYQMPWPMVHFAIATNVSLLNASPNFLLGSIAPDAIHMRDNATRKDKGITHLIIEDRFPSIEIIKTNCLYYLEKSNVTTWKEYILGYFAHIYADLRWTETVYTDFESNYRSDKNDIRKIYNNEVSQVEFNLLRSEDWARCIISELQQSKAFTIEPFVTETEVSQYRDLKLDWLRDDRNEPKIKPIYFTGDIVSNFILKTSNELNALFNEIQTNTWRDSI